MTVLFLKNTEGDGGLKFITGKALYCALLEECMSSLPLPLVKRIISKSGIRKTYIYGQREGFSFIRCSSRIFERVSCYLCEKKKKKYDCLCQLSIYLNYFFHLYI